MEVAAIQFPIGMDVAANLQQLGAGIAGLAPHTFAVAPEGCLSGYLPKPGLTGQLEEASTDQAIEAARAMAATARVHLGVWSRGVVTLS